MTKTIKIPTISIDVTHTEIKQLFLIYIKCLENIENFRKVIFDFSGCSFFSNHAVVFLGGLDLFLKENYSIHVVSYQNQSPNIYSYFERLGFYRKELGWTHFPYSDFSQDDIANKKPYRDINSLLSSNLFPFKSEQDKQAIKDTIGELFLNVLQHSMSPAGATASAQFYPSEDIIRFSVVDFGIGIARHIQNHFEQKFNKRVSSKEALLRAFEEGFTTKANASGSGLKIIKDFVCLNESKMSIFCNDIFYQCDGKTKSEKGYMLEGSHNFSGTFVIIEFNTQRISHFQWE
ncbi:hypothetical protein GF337_15535 [candidate division KSB1 bacterium]|nr:hypothetical protein [candidate division KSB1 bacterium]